MSRSLRNEKEEDETSTGDERGRKKKYEEIPTVIVDGTLYPVGRPDVHELAQHSTMCGVCRILVRYVEQSAVEIEQLWDAVFYRTASRIREVDALPVSHDRSCPSEIGEGKRSNDICPLK
jgi:hypothetical protein